MVSMRYSQFPFNAAYTVTLEEKNINKLQKDAQVYWRYFDQLMAAAGFEK